MEMQARTWLQRLTDESSLWFNAVRAEDSGDMATAASFYLKDAETSGRNRSNVRQALSTSCAANCLSKLGSQSFARELYSQAAKRYLKNAEAVIPVSIREALWSFREAYENLLLAEDLGGARELRNHYMSLAARKSPFSSASLAADELDELDEIAKSVRLVGKSQTPSEIPKQLKLQLEETLKSMKKEAKEPTFRPESIVASMKLGGGSRLDEKGIAS
jgi:hypothetical protein